MPTKPNKLDGSNLRKFKTFGETHSDSLVFPNDLEDQQYYPECIKFGIYERTGIDLSVGKETFKKVTKRTQEIVDQTRKDQEFVDNFKKEKADNEKIEEFNARKAKRDEAKQRLSITTEERLKDIGDVAFGEDSPLNEAFKKRRLESKNPTSRLVENIYLQMPESLIYNEQVDWQGSDLGIVGAIKAGDPLEGAFGGALANAGKILGGAAGTVASLIPGVGTFAAGIIGTVLGGETGLTGGLESTFNIKANPYKEQTFQGVPFRPFEFSFNFRPRNEDEVIAMDNIIRSFRAYSKPNYYGGKLKSGVFKYPHEFLIEFLTLKEDTYYRNEWIPQIKFCVCKSVNTNWTGQGWKSFRDGAPIDTTLTLSFEETEIITQNDVLNENDSVGDFANFGGYF